MPKNFSENALAYFDSVLSDPQATAVDKHRAGKIILSYKTAATKQRKVVSNLRTKLADANARIAELEDQLDLRGAEEVKPMSGIN